MSQDNEDIPHEAGDDDGSWEDESDNELSEGDIERIVDPDDIAGGADDDDLDDEPAEDVVDESIGVFGEHTDSVYTVRFGPNDLAVSGGGDDRGIVWNTKTQKKLFELTGHTDSVVAVGFSSDGKYVASGIATDTVRGPHLTWKHRWFGCLCSRFRRYFGRICFVRPVQPVEVCLAFA